jgi:hypothetical protein
VSQAGDYRECMRGRSCGFGMVTVESEVAARGTHERATEYEIAATVELCRAADRCSVYHTRARSANGETDKEREGRLMFVASRSSVCS